MSVPEHESPAVESYVRLKALEMHLKAHGFTTHHVAGGLVVRNTTSTARTCCGARGVAGDTISCRPHAADGNRYWYFTVRREAPCHIPGAAGRNLEDIPGSDDLPITER